MNTANKFFIGLMVLAVLTPIGLLAQGTAFGEWGSDELKETLGYVPLGIEQAETMWSAPFPDYTLPGLGDDFMDSSGGYIFSAIAGSALIYVSVIILAKFLSVKESKV
jgi:hypothetical protein